MGLFDVFQGGQREDINDAYDEQQRYMRPYTQNAPQDYNDFRNTTSQMGSRLAPFQNAGDYRYSHINQSPTDYYNQIMGGYHESPQAKYEQEAAMRGANFGASASGMQGSGAFEKALQQNAADISANDQQRFYGNVMGANTSQREDLQNFQQQQQAYQQMQQYLASLGYGASMGHGQNSINRGLANAQLDRQNVEDWTSLAGAAASFIKPKMPGVSSVPEYWNKG